MFWSPVSLCVSSSWPDGPAKQLNLSDAKVEFFCRPYQSCLANSLDDWLLLLICCEGINWPINKKTLFQSLENCGNVTYLVPGLPRPCFRVLTNRFRVVSLIIWSRETAVVQTKYPKYGSLFLAEFLGQFLVNLPSISSEKWVRKSPFVLGTEVFRDWLSLRRFSLTSLATVSNFFLFLNVASFSREFSNHLSKRINFFRKFTVKFFHRSRKKIHKNSVSFLLISLFSGEKHNSKHAK